jgi:hypothetical protein
MFYAPRLVFGGTEDVGYLFRVLRSRTNLRRFRSRRVPFSYFAHSDTSSAFLRASGPIFMFYPPGVVSRGTEGVGSHFHVLRSMTRFRRYRVRRVPFSYFARPDSFSAVRRALGPVFMFCSPWLIFGGSEGVRSRFHDLRTQTHFRRYGGRWVPFSCFTLPDSFSAVSRASGRIFMFCTPGLVFGDSEGVGSRFHVFRSRTHFRRYRGRRVLFSCFALLNTFSTEQMALGPIFMFYTPGVVFGSSEGAGYRFRVLRSGSHFSRYRGRRVPFSCFALPN